MKMTRRDFLKLSSAAAAACGVTLLPAQKADAASAIQTLLEEAYLYAFPLVLVDATKTVSTNTKTASASRAPVNQFIHARKLLDASSRTVVSPNVDTIYTQAWLDVSAEPQIYVVPEADRFFNVQVLDAGPTPSPTRAGRARCPRASGASTFPPGRSGPSPASCSPGRTTCRTWRRFRAGCS